MFEMYAAGVAGAPAGPDMVGESGVVEGEAREQLMKERSWDRHDSKQVRGHASLEKCT